MRARTLLAALTGAAIVAGGTAVAAPAPLSVHIAITDHGFGFRNIGIRAANVQLKVTNTGKHRHDLVIARTSTTGAEQSNATVSTKPLTPGQSAMLTLKLKPGRYRLYSKVDHDRAHGLSAPLVAMAPTFRDGAEMSRAFYNFY